MNAQDDFGTPFKRSTAGPTVEYEYDRNKSNNKRLTVSLLLGIAAFLVFCIPVLPMILSGIGLWQGIKGKNTDARGLALWAITLNAFMLLFTSFMTIGMIVAWVTNP